MQNKSYIHKVIEQSIIMLFLIAFFNIDNTNHLNVRLNFYNIWLFLSWICQFYIVKRKIWSLSNLSFLQLGARITQQEHAKYHIKDKWGDNSYANVQHNLSTQRLALWDTNFDMTVNFFIRIGYALLGPIILMFDIVKDLVEMNEHQK